MLARRGKSSSAAADGGGTLTLATTTDRRVAARLHLFARCIGAPEKPSRPWATTAALGASLRLNMFDLRQEIAQTTSIGCA